MFRAIPRYRKCLGAGEIVVADDHHSGLGAGLGGRELHLDGTALQRYESAWAIVGGDDELVWRCEATQFQSGRGLVSNGDALRGTRGAHQLSAESET